MPKLLFTDEARSVLQDLASNANYETKLRKVRKALALLETNPRHPGLNSHKWTSVRGEDGQDVWDSYVENNTPSAWRIFWHYGPDRDQITVVTIGPHP